MSMHASRVFITFYRIIRRLFVRHQRNEKHTREGKVWMAVYSINTAGNLALLHLTDKVFKLGTCTLN